MTAEGPLKGRLAGAVRGLARNEAGAFLIAYTIAMLLLRLGSNVVLTRLLDPHAFGVMGVISSVFVILTMLSDFGFSSFIIRHEKGGEPRFLDVIWTIRLVQSVVQSAVMLAGAVPIAAVVGKPMMIFPIMVCAPLFILNALCPMAALVAQREGLVRKACAIDAGALAIQIAVNLLLTLIFQDYRALIVGLYAGAVARALLTHWILRRPSRWSFDKGVAREFFAFSRIVMASSFVTLLITQSDKVLFARLFTLSDFGVYMLAVGLALSAQPFGRDYVLRFFYPFVSRTWRETPDRLPFIFYDARRRIYPLLFVGMGLGIGLSPLVFAILFDPRYDYGWIYLAVLMMRAAFDLDSFASSQTLLAMGRAASTLHANLVRITVFLLALLLIYRPLGPIALPVSLVFAEIAATIYVSALLGKAGIFRFRDHAIYYAALSVGTAAGTSISMSTVPALVTAGLKGIG